MMRGALLLLLGSASAFCPGGTAATDIEQARMGQSVSPEHSAAQWPLLDHHTIETGRFETGDIPNATSLQFCNTTCVAPPPPPPAYKCLVDPPPGSKPCQSCDPSDPGAMSLDKCYRTCDPSRGKPRPAWPRIPMTSAGVH